MKTNHKTVFRSLVVAVVILLVGLFTLSVAQAAPLFQDERPPVDGDGDGGGDGGGGSGGRIW